MLNTPINMFDVNQAGAILHYIFNNPSKTMNKTFAIVGDKLRVDEIAHMMTKILKPNEFKDMKVKFLFEIFNMLIENIIYGFKKKLVSIKYLCKYLLSRNRSLTEYISIFVCEIKRSHELYKYIWQILNNLKIIFNFSSDSILLWSDFMIV